MIDYVPKFNSISYLNFNIAILRLDLIHPEISGNKWFKLKYNIEKAKSQNLKTILTFGGAFSNHIAATAAACKIEGLVSIGIIRGEESTNLNSTLHKAKEDGMRLLFLDREAYAQKDKLSFQNYLTELLGQHYLIPEGGNNSMPEPVEQNMTIPSPFVLTIQNVESEHDGTEGTIRVTTNQQLVDENIKSYIKFEPDIKFTAEVDETGLTLRKYVNASYH